MKDLRMGTFKISMALIEENPKAIMQIMGRVIVVRAECMYINIVKYVAISPEFDEIEEGDKVPEYDVIVTAKKKGNKNIVDKITFKKVN